MLFVAGTELSLDRGGIAARTVAMMREEEKKEWGLAMKRCRRRRERAAAALLLAAKQHAAHFRQAYDAQITQLDVMRRSFTVSR